MIGWLIDSSDTPPQLNNVTPEKRNMTSMANKHKNAERDMNSMANENKNAQTMHVRPA